MINHDFRRKGIGASDVAAILEMSPWQTPLALWHYIKKGVTGADNASLKNGRQQEKFILDTYEQEKDTYLLRNQPLVSDINPVLRCNVDGIQSPIVIVEAKTAYHSDHWGEDESHTIPKYYMTQVAYQRLIGNVEKVDIAVKFSKDPRVHYYYYAPNLRLENYIKEKVLAWWDKYIVENKEPSPFDKDKNPKLHAYDLKTFVQQKHLIAPDHIMDICRAYNDSRAKKKLLEDDQKEMQAAMRAWVKENKVDGKTEIWTPDGKKLALQTFHTSTKVDRKRLEADGIDVNKYIVTNSSLMLKIN